MENIYAAMLLHKAGKEINEETLTGVLSAAGITADPVRVKALVASLSEVNIDEAIKAAPPEDKKKKAEEEKQNEDAALEGLGALFG